MSQGNSLPERPNLDWYRKAAKKKLAELRAGHSHAKLADAQLAIAREHGFSSWRKLKSAVDERRPDHSVFESARRGDLDAVRTALDAGFDITRVDPSGRTLNQIARYFDHAALETMLKPYLEQITDSGETRKLIHEIRAAASRKEPAKLRQLLDQHPDLVNARHWSGGGTALHGAAYVGDLECVKLLVERGGDPDIRDFGDNAYPLHYAAEMNSLEVVDYLSRITSDLDGNGDDHELAVIGWATCFDKLRADVAHLLLSRGAKLNIWAAIALDDLASVRRLVEEDRGTLRLRLGVTESRRTPLHFAATKNRVSAVKLLLDLGADPDATDSVGQTPLASTGSKTDPKIVELLTTATRHLDLPEALAARRFDLAEQILRSEPQRIRPGGRNDRLVCRAVERGDVEVVAWLIDHGADASQRAAWNNEATLLHLAPDDPEMVRLLLSKGADPTLLDSNHKATPLGWARFLKKERAAAAFVELGVTR